MRMHALVPLQLTWLTALHVCRIILRMVDSIYYSQALGALCPLLQLCAVLERLLPASVIVLALKPYIASKGVHFIAELNAV